MTASPSDRPRSVIAAFWCWVVAALLLIVGGLLTATAGLPGMPVIFRGTGALVAVVGLGIAFLAGKSRAHDLRYRRAALALALATVVLVALLALVGIISVLALIALLPLIAGVVCITRPSADTWFAAAQEPLDG
jgi:hypothetical protein